MEQTTMPVNNTFKIIVAFLMLFAASISGWFYIFNLIDGKFSNGITALLSISSTFQSIQSWQPLIHAAQEGYFFSTSPNFNPSSQDIRFLPYLAIWCYGLIQYITGETGQLVFSWLVFPLVSFFFLYRIIRRHLDRLWSTTITLTALFSFSGYPFRHFLTKLLEFDHTVGS